MAEHTVTFRMPTLVLLALPAALGCVALSLLALATATHSAPVGAAGFYVLFLGMWLLAANTVLRVQLGPAGIRIRSVRRRYRPVRWDEIRAVTAEVGRGGRRVTLWTIGGEPVRLPLPMGNRGLDGAAFLSGYHQIGQYWQYMQATNQPLPGPA